jgi:uncharacterized protein YutE (UPF0331/DUF86 family)
MDAALVEKRLAHITSCVAQLRALVRPESLKTDPVQLGFAIYTLQTAVQAAIDVAAVIVAERRLGEPATNRDMFAKLAGDGWTTPARAEAWKRIVSFRNVAVHRYLDVDTDIVEAILAGHLDDLLQFAADVRRRLPEVQGEP